MKDTEEILAEIAMALAGSYAIVRCVQDQTPMCTPACTYLGDALIHLESAKGSVAAARLEMIAARNGIDRGPGDFGPPDTSMPDEMSNHDTNMSPIPFSLPPPIIATGVVLFLGWLAWCLAGCA